MQNLFISLPSNETGFYYAHPESYWFPTGVFRQYIKMWVCTVQLCIYTLLSTSKLLVYDVKGVALVIYNYLTVEPDADLNEHLGGKGFQLFSSLVAHPLPAYEWWHLKQSVNDVNSKQP